MNAIIVAARNGVSTAGCTMYCTLPPCSGCAKALINAGILRIVYPADVSYPSAGQDLFAQALVQVDTIDGFGQVEMVELEEEDIGSSLFRDNLTGRVVEILGVEESGEIRYRYLDGETIAYKTPERFKAVFKPCSDHDCIR
jgi:hypothetical protein